MSIQELYLIVVALATLLPALLIGPVLRHRHKPGATGLLILIVGSITMSFGVGMNTVAPTPRYWIYFANLMILGASLSATGYFLLVADYTNLLRTTYRVLLVGALYPGTVQIALWTNPLHHLAWDPVETVATSTMLGTHETARIFVWAHAVFGYSIVTLAIVLALREAFRSSGRRRLQSVALFATGFPPALLFLLSDLNLTSLNLVPIGGLLQVFALVWVLFYADFLDVVPVARYRAIEHMSDPVVTIDAQGTVLDSNPAARALASAGADWEGTPIETFFHRFPNQATNLTAVESVAVTTSDDTQRHFDVTSTPIYAPDGTIEAHQIVLRDISERVRRSQELKQSRQRYQSLFENCPIVLWEHDLSAVIERAESLADTCDDLATYLAEHPAEHDRLLELVDVREVNQHALDAYGASSKAELVEQYPALQTDDSRATNRQLIRQLLGGKRHFRDETTHRTLNGDVRHELIEVTVPQSVSDDCSRVLVACVDVTDAKTYERQLEAHNRTLERLAGIISHDLQTPLSTAKMTTTVLRLKLEEADSDVPQSVADLEQIHRRMQEFTEYLPRLARESTNVKHTTECDLATLAEAAWDVVHTHSLSLVIDDTTTVEGDPSRLQQMFENLFQNVVDHGLKPIATDREPDSDRIDRHEIQTTTVNSNSTLDVDDVATTVHVGTFAGGFYVADDGPGLRTTSPEIFDYGMGTGTGSGFGLAIVRTIVEAHGFTITATESDDGGARFEIRTRRTDT